LKAEGPLTDATRNFQRDAKGNVVLGSNGLPQNIVPATDALGVSKLTYLDRAAHAKKEYLRFFPSANASFNLTEKLVARAAYYHSIGRPNFNQYAGGLTLPNAETDPSPSNRITVNNVAIKPWSAKSATARLEYYFAGVGQISIGGFRRDFENFFGGSVFPATPEFLALYGLDPNEYGRYEVSTQRYLTSTLRMTGANVGYRQALIFLPSWARGLQVFANGSTQRLTGEASAQSNLSAFFPRSASAGVSLTREKFSLRANWSYRSARRNAAVTGQSIDPGTYNWNRARVQVDLLGEYYLRKNFSVFANLHGVNTPWDENIQIFGPRTPAFAQFKKFGDIGSLWTFGVKGNF